MPDPTTERAYEGHSTERHAQPQQPITVCG